jgi:hypothetical protein
MNLPDWVRASAEQLSTYARERQQAGELLGWSIHWRARPPYVDFFVPDDVPLSSFPSQVAGIAIHLQLVGRAQEEAA